MSALVDIVIGPLAVALAWGLLALKDELLRRWSERRVRRTIRVNLVATGVADLRLLGEQIAEVAEQSSIARAKAEAAAQLVAQQRWGMYTPPLSIDAFRDEVERVTAAAIVERDEARHTTHCTWCAGAVNAHCLALRLLGGYGMQSFDLEWARTVLAKKGEPRSDKLHWSQFPGLRQYDLAGDPAGDDADPVPPMSGVEWPLAAGIFPPAPRDAAAEPTETDSAAPPPAAATTTGDVHA